LRLRSPSRGTVCVSISTTKSACSRRFARHRTGLRARHNLRASRSSPPPSRMRSTSRWRRWLPIVMLVSAGCLPSTPTSKRRRPRRIE
jgi:hypothetical protein